MKAEGNEILSDVLWANIESNSFGLSVNFSYLLWCPSARSRATVWKASGTDLAACHSVAKTLLWTWVNCTRTHKFIKKSRDDACNEEVCTRNADGMIVPLFANLRIPAVEGSWRASTRGVRRVRRWPVRSRATLNNRRWWYRCVLQPWVRWYARMHQSHIPCDIEGST